MFISILDKFGKRIIINVDEIAMVDEKKGTIYFNTPGLTLTISEPELIVDTILKHRGF